MVVVAAAYIRSQFYIKRFQVPAKCCPPRSRVSRSFCLVASSMPQPRDLAIISSSSLVQPNISKSHNDDACAVIIALSLKWKIWRSQPGLRATLWSTHTNMLQLLRVCAGYASMRPLCAYYVGVCPLVVLRRWSNPCARALQGRAPALRVLGSLHTSCPQKRGLTSARACVRGSARRKRPSRGRRGHRGLPMPVLGSVPRSRARGLEGRVGDRPQGRLVEKPISTASSRKVLTQKSPEGITRVGVPRDIACADVRCIGRLFPRAHALGYAKKAKLKPTHSTTPESCQAPPELGRARIVSSG